MTITLADARTWLGVALGVVSIVLTLSICWLERRKAKKQARDLEARAELAERRFGQVLPMAVELVTRAVEAGIKAKEAEMEVRDLRSTMKGRAQSRDDAGNVIAALDASVRRRVVSAEASAAAGEGGA
ncbi:hypothetical protein B0T24DRAFT_683563 [Lasiosphaeria ovina]|uniref:Uncharacterized protein n=1 Tax=Lasiosphaeria ovina TaxID=92902 RepID=A0AAE0JVT9_9PEZI|nr:hypothetical protein B0T24DRAFT_683563 [Lasiosphaeria ovina]